MSVRISRQAVLGLGPATLASCARREPYFGKSTPPRSQTLIYELAGEGEGGFGAESPEHRHHPRDRSSRNGPIFCHGVGRGGDPSCLDARTAATR
jgi:hypothetical protein